jgi:Leucine-rich repeat (LRR) protein
MFTPTRRCFVPILFVLLLAPLALHAAIPSIQRQALIALYNSTSGDSWTYKTGWKDGELDTDGFALPGTEGTWYGVTVEADNVTWLGPGQNNLVGTIPAALGNLTSLQFLNLNQNQLSGSIPAELGNLVDLQQLYLSYNQLSGTIPASLGNLTALQTLMLPYNQLTGSIPAQLGNLINLEQFWLSGNQLSGSIPASFGSMTKMRILHLDNCGLGGSIPAELGNLAELTELFLYNSLYNGSIPASLGNLKKLQRLWLTGNQLSGSIPAELGGMTALYDLQFGGNQLTGSIPAEIGNLTNLTGLALYVNQLTGPIPPELGNLTGLRSLFLSSNQLSGSIPAELGNLTNLTNLTLMSNDLTGQIPAALGSLTRLNTLDLRYNRLTGTIPAAIGSLTGLRYLYLNANVLSGPIPTALMNLTLLSYTDIGYNALYTSDPALITFLNSKDADWAATQTVAPTNVTAEAIDGAAVRVSWTPIPFTGFTGYYKIYHAQSAGGPYGLAGQTADKTASTFDVTGLNHGQPYYFVVQTHSNPHQNNYYKNHVESEYSTEVTATPWLQVNIRVTGTITVGGSPLANVVMSGLPGDPVTDPLGIYDTTFDAGWSGTVTPTLLNHTFSPSSRTYTAITEDQLAQNYTATYIAPSITVTAPNGGESWGTGTSHDITWTQTGLAGNVTIDLYKGGVYQKTLGTPGVTAGVFSWSIDADEPLGADYRVRIWVDAASDDSDADFAIASSRKDDLLGTWDGQGVYYRNSDTGGWYQMASPATMIASGDLDGDGIDDLIGIWPSQGGVWVKYSSTGGWAYIASTAQYISTGDMNGDGRVDLLGNWVGQGVYYKDSMTGSWVLMASEATMIASGDLDGDGTDDLLGIWPSQGGVWIKYSMTGNWAYIGSTAQYISSGDMNGDGRDDLLGNWIGQGVYYRDSMTGSWVLMASEATMIASGDLDGDGIDDLLGIWPSQGGVWVKYSTTGGWQLLSSTAQYIATGKMRPVGSPAPEVALALSMPMGGTEPGPEAAVRKMDESSKGPGGWRFVWLQEKNLVPTEEPTARLTRTPGPGEPLFNPQRQMNLSPEETAKKRTADQHREKAQRINK